MLDHIRQGNLKASYVLAQSLLVRVAEILGSADIPVLPLKGVLLQATVYNPPWSRPLSDVDILVPEERYFKAIDILQEHGWKKTHSNMLESSLKPDEYPYTVDLHRRLFPRFTFGLQPSEMFERAKPDETFSVQECG